MSSCESLCCIVLQQQPMHHFPISGKDCEQMVQWFLIDWSFVLEDGSSLCRTIMMYFLHYIYLTTIVVTLQILHTKIF